MWKYQLVDGTLINVPKEKREKFLNENPGAILILPGESVDKKISTDSTIYNIDGKKYEVSKEKEKQFFDDFKGQKIIQEDEILGTKRTKIQHASLEDFKDNIGDSIWNKEENAEKFLNDYYRYGLDLDVRFVQTGKLKNRLKMLVGGEKDSDKIIDIGKGRSWKDVHADISRRVDNAFGSKEKNEELDQKILDKIKGIEEKLWFDDDGKSKAEFSTSIYKNINPDELIEGSEKYGNRLTSTPVLGKLWQIHEADMSGGITVKMDDGEEVLVPYTYLWDKRNDLKKKVLENRNVNLTTELISKFGTEEDLDQYLEDNSHIYFTPKEYELYVLQRELEGAKDKESKSDIEKEIQTQLSKMYPNYSKEDLKAMVLYNEDGEFIRIKKPPPEEGTLEAEIEDDANDLANTNDLDWLTKERQQAYIELINLAKIAYANRDNISERQSWALSALENVIDAGEGKWTSDKNWSKDVENLKRVAETNDIFGLEDVTEFGKLSGLPDGTALGNEFDAALRKFRTLSRAVDLNIDISRTPEETVFRDFVGRFRENITGLDRERDEDEARDVFQGTLEYDGYEVPDHVIESSFWKNGRLGKNNNYRKVVEGGSDVIADLSPLLIELGVFKRVGGLKRLKTAWGGLATRLTPATANPITRKIINKLIVPGLITTSEWSIAEVAGQSLLGTQHADAWKAHTVNLETGETFRAATIKDVKLKSKNYKIIVDNITE